MLPFLSKRVATPIGNHPIVGLFDPEARDRLSDILSPADWSHITVCRLRLFGQGPVQCPVTILVGVRPNTMDSNQAAELLRSAADLIYRFAELHDVAIEIIEADAAADASDSAASRRRNHCNEQPFNYKFEETFCHQPLIGVGIALSESTLSGTLGGRLPQDWYGYQAEIRSADLSSRFNL